MPFAIALPCAIMPPQYNAITLPSPIASARHQSRCSQCQPCANALRSPGAVFSQCIYALTLA